MKRSMNAVLTCVVLPWVALGVVSCGSPTALEQDIRFETDRLSYALGDTAVLTVTNLGPAHIQQGWVHCLLEIERKTGATWEFSSRPETSAHVSCLTRPPDLKPGENDEREFPVTATHFDSAGEYRFETTYFNESGTRTILVTSNAFSVEH